MKKTTMPQDGFIELQREELKLPTWNLDKTWMERIQLGNAITYHYSNEVVFKIQKEF